MSSFFRTVNRKALSYSLTTALLAAMSTPLHAEQEFWEYEMQPGDNVWKIAHEMLTDWRAWKEITQLNNVSNDRLMAAGTTLRIPRSLVKTRNAEVDLLTVSGEVQIQRNGSSTREALTDSLTLAEGDRLLTSANSSALIEFEDKSKVLLTPDSELVIKRSSVIGAQRKVIDINVELEEGEAEIRANPNKTDNSRFVIETPSAFATTRGTVYRVRAAGDETAAEVTQGKIEVGNAVGSRYIPQSYGVITQKDAPIQPPKKLLDAPQLPALGTVRYLPAKLQWDKINGAVAYRSQVSEGKTFDSLVLDSIGPANKANLPVALADGVYWLRVRGADSEGLQGNESIAQFTIDARPFPPVIQKPRTKDKLYSGPVDFIWTEPEGADNYRFELAADEAFTKIVTTTTVSDTSLTLEQVQEGNYFWRVTSITDEGKVGPAGHSTAINVKPVPKTPELAEPSIGEDQISLAWQPDPNTQYFQLQIASDKAFENIIVDTRSDSADAEIQKPEPGSYYMRVRGFDNDNYAGAWTSPQKIDVPIENFLPMILWGIFSVAIFL